jgi:hypothetical protein
MSWDREIPKYRTTRTLNPSPLERHARETPWSYCSDNDVWQYGTKPLAAHEEISTTSWPHPSMQPLNESARRVRNFFCDVDKSRLPRSPWQHGCVIPHLAKAMSNTLER